MIVDAHVHLWERAAVDHPWLTADAGVLDADFTVADLAPVLADSGVDTAVVVQSADSLDETAYLDRLAAATPWIAATVGWLPLLDPERCARLLEASTYPSMVGVRHLVHTEVDPDWLIRPVVLESLQLIAEATLTLDVPAEYPLHLDQVEAVAGAVPSLTVVVDHLGKPPIGSDELGPWSARIRALGAHPNVVAKVSGLNTATTDRSWRADDLRPVVDAAIEAFGVDRLLFGSDWPVLLANGDYPRVLAATHAVLDGLSDGERAAVLGSNAIRVYGLADRGREGPP